MRLTLCSAHISLTTGHQGQGLTQDLPGLLPKKATGFMLMHAPAMFMQFVCFTVCSAMFPHTHMHLLQGGALDLRSAVRFTISDIPPHVCIWTFYCNLLCLLLIKASAQNEEKTASLFIISEPQPPTILSNKINSTGKKKM